MQIFDQQANQYYKLAKRRYFPGNKYRKALLQKAHGKVLEIACGAGNNLRYYSRDVTHLTLVDVSREMIDRAKKVEAEISPKVSFITDYKVSHAESLVLEDHDYDTLVSTLSVCAYSDPVNTLSHALDFVKVGGSILFLEHGISNFALVNFFQRRLDQWHKSKKGCHLDRDISMIIKSLPGIEIFEMRRFLFGIGYCIYARKVR